MTGRKPQEVVKIFDQLRRLFAIKFFDCKQSEDPEMKNPAESGVSAGFFNVCAGAVSGP